MQQGRLGVSGPLKGRKGPGWLWRGAAARLSKKWLAPLFRGFHSSLAPTARPGSYERKPLLRKAFCGFDAHPPGGLLLSLRDNSPCVAKSDYSLKGPRSSIRQRFFDKLFCLAGPGPEGPRASQTPPPPRNPCGPHIPMALWNTPAAACRQRLSEPPRMGGSPAQSAGKQKRLSSWFSPAFSKAGGGLGAAPPKRLSEGREKGP